MKSDAKTDEIAGRGEQKLPRTSAKSAATGESTGKSEVRVISSSAETKSDPFTPEINPAVASKFVKTATANVESTPASPSPAVAGQVERLARMVSQEVVMIKQSGASSLAVSLKVDAHTELFLQLADHDGQLQASIRLERGNITGLSEHWGQLQDSLARQNIQLLPLEERAGTRHSTHNPFSNQNGSTPQDQNEHGRSQRAQQQFADDASVSGNPTKPSRASTKTKSKTKVPKVPGPDGWESWA